jgi:hypothetical protein
VQRRRRNPLVIALLVVIALMVVSAGVVVFTIGSVAVLQLRHLRQARRGRHAIATNDESRCSNLEKRYIRGTAARANTSTSTRTGARLP